MDLEKLKERFYQLVAPSLPNEWDVEEALGPLLESEAQHLEEIFGQVPAIWPVSHSLCFAYLTAAGPALCCLALDDLSLWVHTLLDRYETGGLHGAQAFMADVEQQFARRLRGEGGLRLSEVRPRLQPYVNGLAGHELPLIAAAEAATDGETIYLPSEIGLFAAQEDNFLIYKLMASFQWATLASGLFAAPPFLSLERKSAHPLDCFFSQFAHPGNARVLFHLFETGRMLLFLRRELPGLMRQATPLLPRLLPAGEGSDATGLLPKLQRLLILGDEPGQPEPDQRLALVRVLMERCAQGDDNTGSLEAVQELLPHLTPDEDLSGAAPLIFQGVLRLQEMRNLGLKRQTDKELRMMASVHMQLPPATATTDAPTEPGNQGGQQGQDIALIMEAENSWEQLSPFMQSQIAPLDIQAMAENAATGNESQGGGQS